MNKSLTVENFEIDKMYENGVGVIKSSKHI